jgi:glycine/D-amino acid oxidase-like deaminating enzyme
MHTDVLVIGQGICGTMLSYFLIKEGKTVVVLDDERPNTASAVAAGIINP